MDENKAKAAMFGAQVKKLNKEIAETTTALKTMEEIRNKEAGKYEKEKQNNAKSINNQAAAAIQCESERATVGFWDALCRATITSSGCVCNTTRMSCCFRGTRGDA